MNEEIVRLPDLEASEALGERLAAWLQRGRMITLSGDLGVGKTALARAVIGTRLRAQGRSEAIPSPTFSLVQHYETGALAITHADLYRVEAAQEMRELDLEGALESGALLVEWPRYMDGLQPRARLDISLWFDGDGRMARLTTPAPRPRRRQREAEIAD